MIASQPRRAVATSPWGEPDGKTSCTLCKNTGKCSVCSGSGKVVKRNAPAASPQRVAPSRVSARKDDDEEDDDEEDKEPCDVCGGSGKCKECDGSGWSDKPGEGELAGLTARDVALAHKAGVSPRKLAASAAANRRR